jgi:hypothetical protein
MEARGTRLPLAQSETLTFTGQKRKGNRCFEEPKEAEGSHFKVTFPEGTRHWPLDPNVDPIPNRFLGQLTASVHLPPEVIKDTLITGSLCATNRPAPQSCVCSVRALKDSWGSFKELIGLYNER